MNRDSIQKCINDSQVSDSGVLASNSLINIGLETMDKQPIDQALQTLQANTVNGNLATDEDNALTVMEILKDNDYMIHVNPYKELYGKKASETIYYTDELRKKYGETIPTIKEIGDMMVKAGDSECKGITFNSVKYSWFDPETLKFTDKNSFFSIKTVGDRRFIVSSGVSLSRLDETLEIRQQKLRSLRLRMMGLFFVIWAFITIIYYLIYKENLPVFIGTGILGLFVVYVQITRPFPLSDEANIFSSLNTTLRAIVVTLGSLSILITKIDIRNTKSIVALLLTGFIIALSAIIITPRRENIEKLHQVNDILRVFIALGITCLLTGIVIAFL